MSDLRVDTRAIEAKYGLHQLEQQEWAVTPVGQPQAKQMVTLDNAGAAGGVVHKVAAIFEARSMAQHREAVEAVEEELQWDAPDIRLNSKGHLRWATYIFKKLARPHIVPLVAAVSEPSPGCTLIEVDTVYVLAPNKPWFAPITWLLPDEAVSNVHMKIGVNGSLEHGKIELMVARWTNWPPIPPFGWQRGLAGMLLGAVPHAVEGVLGHLIDWAEGGGYYGSLRMQRFRQRHRGSTAPTWQDWLEDAAEDVQQWAVEQAGVAVGSGLAVAMSFLTHISSCLTSIISFWVWAFTSLLNLAPSTYAHDAEGAEHQAADDTNQTHARSLLAVAAGVPVVDPVCAKAGPAAARGVRGPAAPQQHPIDGGTCSAQGRADDWP